MDAVQTDILRSVADGHSVFFTGPAGVGKTFVLNEIITHFRNRYGHAFQKKVAVAGMTGIAASHINGATLNSILGIGVPRAAGDVGNGLHRRRRDIDALDVLILDECSMLSAELFYLFVKDPVLTKRKKPLQLVFCGDFFQLAPIPNKHVKSLLDFGNYGLAFETREWSETFAPERCFVLKKVYRQDDAEFVETLDRIRTGRHGATEALRELVRECSRELSCPEGIKPTMVYPKNVDIDAINERELAKLKADERTFRARDSQVLSPEAARDSSQRLHVESVLAKDAFYKNCSASGSIVLKTGAQVILLRNIDIERGLCNGSRGVVVDFVQSGKEACVQLLPVVRFVNGEEVTIEMMTYEHEVPGLGVCRRQQVPLRLAWAISMHKSQGMTLDAVVVSLQGIFASGQAYVALSRARSKAGLQIVGWDGRSVPVDARVARFYEDVESNETIEPSQRWIAYADARGWLNNTDRCLIVATSSEESEPDVD